MVGGTEEGGGVNEAPQETAPAPLVLDDTDYAIPDEWGIKEAYNDEESVINH